MARVFETMAAMIPTVVLLLHLLMRHSGMAPVEGLPHAQLSHAAGAQMVVTQELTVVPEPKASALVGVGVGALLFLRSKGKTGCRPDSGQAGTQASRIAIAVA